MRRLGFVLLGLAGLWILVEFYAVLALFVFADDASLASVAAERANAAGEAGDAEVPPETEASMSLHPYLGYVANPEANAEWEPLVDYLDGLEVSSFGFFDSDGPFREPAPDRLVVGIFGGSLALYYSVHGIEATLRELRKQEALRDVEVSFVRIALQGYKQPQQLMALAYLLTLGAHFDVVVNIDGFNEVALPAAENLTQRVSPWFPRKWKTRVEGLPDLEAQALAGQVAILRERRRRGAEFFESPPGRYSAIAAIVWRYWDAAQEREIQQTLAALEQREGAARSYTVTGPPWRYPDMAAMYADLVRIWANASLQMARLTEGAGARYLHFLQPNQYVPGSKPLGDEERRVAFLEEFPMRPHIVAGYPLLRSEGARLREAGVDFHDLTMLFEDRPEPLYLDACCHLNPEGNARLGAAIGAALATALAPPAPRDPS